MFSLLCYLQSDSGESSSHTYYNDTGSLTLACPFTLFLEPEISLINFLLLCPLGSMWVAVFCCLISAPPLADSLSSLLASLLPFCTLSFLFILLAFHFNCHSTFLLFLWQTSSLFSVNSFFTLSWGVVFFSNDNPLPLLANYKHTSHAHTQNEYQYSLVSLFSHLLTSALDCLQRQTQQ